ncbi:hypothetical protein CLV58_102257 [Spirosoma oryzae]|uniref:Uncharacterized protein n=2 Tax=Spirosoma TaxID=107 RepID=A0A2T0TJ09_9BACT|nr:hypothetical protein [Spirosoma oryzae]PRY45508.1 hypothetical protein CLV58_102257 [Spirosoma oryzae]
MQFSVNVPDEKVSFFLELIKNLRFVKIEPVTVQEEEVTAEQLKAEIKEAVNEMKLVRQGKKKSRPIEDLLNELQH